MPTVPTWAGTEDKLLQHIVHQEKERQQYELELIASENYLSPEVMHAMANVFTNKYAEGYPGKRYYGGQHRVDRLECLTQWRALRMFDLLPSVTRVEEQETVGEKVEAILATSDWIVNVQPLSGGPANAGVYLWLLQPGDGILGMSLDAWGHLSHGHPLNMSWQYYTIHTYGVDPSTMRIDYDQIEQQAIETKPRLIVAGGSAYTRIIDWSAFARIAQRVEQVHRYRPLVMADVAHVAGLIAWGVYPSPFPHCDVVTTTTHKTLRWPRWGLIFAKKEHQKHINRWLFPGIQWGPHQHILVAKAQAFGEIIYGWWRIQEGDSFAAYAQRVVENARTLATELQQHGWELLSWWTDTHMLLRDVTMRHQQPTDYTGSTYQQQLEDIWLSANKNMLPYDTRSPMDPSGIRVGTAAITTRWLGEDDMRWLADILSRAIDPQHDKDALRQQVRTYCEKFPLPYT